MHNYAIVRVWVCGCTCVCMCVWARECGVSTRATAQFLTQTRHAATLSSIFCFSMHEVSRDWRALFVNSSCSDFSPRELCQKQSKWHIRCHIPAFMLINFFNFKHLKHVDLQRLNFCSQCWNYERCLLGIIPVWKASIFFAWRRALQGCLKISHFLLPNPQKSARQCADNSQKLPILSPSPLCDYYRMIVRYWFACCCATCCIKSLLAACAFSQLLRNCNAWIRAHMRS